VNEELRSVLLGTAGLSVGAVVALFLTVTRGRIGAGPAALRASVRLAAFAVLLRSAHFAEELATGFHQRFPGLLGLAPWSSRFFISFNLFWLAAWGLGLWGLATRHRSALFPLWFLAIAGIANGLAHPLFSVRIGDYFPGLFTSPFVGVVGLLLLFVVTGPRNASLGAA